METIKIKFAKVNPNAIIPSKRLEDAGYDIYPCFNDEIIIYPNETVMIPCGIASSFESCYVMILKERGSTGTKGMAQRSGVIDSGYRGEWLCPITNTNNKPIIIKDILNDDIYNNNYIIYPKSKAICQALLLPVPITEILEVDYDDILRVKSERMSGKLGSSEK